MAQASEKDLGQRRLFIGWIDPGRRVYNVGFGLTTKEPLGCGAWVDACQSCILSKVDVASPEHRQQETLHESLSCNYTKQEIPSPLLEAIKVSPKTVTRSFRHSQVQELRQSFGAWRHGNFTDPKAPELHAILAVQVESLLCTHTVNVQRDMAGSCIQSEASQVVAAEAQAANPHIAKGMPQHLIASLLNHDS